MKKALLLTFLFVSLCSASFAQKTTDDYMYIDGIKTVNGNLCFDVIMKGSDMYYTAFQADIQLPSGLRVKSKRGGAPSIDLLSIEATFNDDEGFTEHSIATNFPEEGNQTFVRIGCSSSGNYNMAQTSGPLFRVFVEKVDATWPIGSIQFSNALFITDDAIGYEIANREYVVVIKEDATLPLKVSSAAKWSTCVLPFSAEIPDGVTAYTCSSNDNENIYLTEAVSFEAYTPYILYSENGYSANIGGTVDAEGCPANGVSTDGYLVGAVVPQTVKEGYILQKHGEDVKFYAIDEGDSFVVPAGKCWMNIPEVGVKAFNFVVDNGETGIQTTLDVKRNSCVYDLTGRRISTMKKDGLYIKNGEKFINR